jgi:hypothetical protein
LIKSSSSLYSSLVIKPFKNISLICLRSSDLLSSNSISFSLNDSDIGTSFAGGGGVGCSFIFLSIYLLIQ